MLLYRARHFGPNTPSEQRSISVAIDAMVKDAWVSKRDVASVIVSHADNTYFVRGGALNPHKALVFIESAPELTLVENEPYILVTKKSPIIVALAGKELTRNNFLDQVITLRNAACEAAVKRLRSEAGLEVPEPNKSGRARLYRRDAVADIRPPEVVTLEFPPIDGEEPFFLPVVFESTGVPQVHVPLEARALDWLVTQLRASGNTSLRGVKRNRDDSQDFKYKDVHWQESRRKGYVDYRDADGRPHRHYDEHVLPANDNLDPADREVFMLHMSERLHLWFIQNHHEKPKSPGAADVLAEECEPADAAGVLAEECEPAELGNAVGGGENEQECAADVVEAQSKHDECAAE